MGNIFSSLSVVAESLRTTQRAIEVTSNNVVNARTPGYVKQSLTLIARRFEVESGLAGGVEAGNLQSSRKQFLEQGVQDQAHRQGRLAQQSAYLERLEPIFDVASGAGIHGALNRLFESFSALSVNPNDTPIRQTVLDRARELAHSFRYAVTSLQGVRADSSKETQAAVDRINRLGAAIRDYNNEVRLDHRKQNDAGLEAQVYQAMEDLAEQVDFDVLRAEDGSFTINLGGQTPLVIGDHLFAISGDFSGPQARIMSAQGDDITGQLTQGRLRGLLDVQDSFSTSLLGDLNRLAAGVASEVNAVLASGLDRNGQPPTTDLFRYDAAAGAASSLSVNPLTTDELAAASAGAQGGNGNALAASALSKKRVLDDFTFSQFYGSVAGRVGQTLASSKQEEQTQSLLLSQAKSLRAEQSAVNLDEEAANLIAFQRQYQANAEMIRVLNQLTEDTINIIR